MLQFYYNPRSPMARRVWRGLLEKDIPFEPVLMNLNGDQFQPDYLEINPFHHVPVIVDDGFRMVESIAILEYLETKYPHPPLLPKETQALATVRMVQMVSTNELVPKVLPLILENQNSPSFLEAKQQVEKILEFFADNLKNNSYFGGDNLSLADIIAGTDISFLPYLGINFSSYPNLNNWFQRLTQRPSWQKTELSAEEFEQFRRVLMIMRKRKIKP
ncbi:glutathione S-transferase family protein [Rivularia sp. UHCC 0363]|uniref:glutathione S-transferase family protein n=1 Tax=Rivularia sp. UHCC 0363 TaxID=3110244 RepID=UPI002B20A3E9|nr:glutathione S-transferase family protein [Rivularia sp. UHCC 0363]MEA5596425.1 glutathione S-transferase family protein [Rivularia sp. UHCC 0363]